MSTAKTIALHKALGGGSESGGGAGLVVTFTGSGTTLTADKTFNEVLAAIENGTFAYAKYGASVFMPGAADENLIRFERTALSDSAESVIMTSIRWYNRNSPATYLYDEFNKYVLPLGLLMDGMNAYADPPSGTLSLWAYDSSFNSLASVFSGATNNGSYGDANRLIGGVFLLNGDPYNGGRIDRYEPVSANVENAGEENETITIVFQTIGIRNGSVLLKRVTVSGGPWDSLDDATVTYSETAL